MATNPTVRAPTNDWFHFAQLTVVGRVESTAPTGTGRSRGETSKLQHGRQLSRPSLTFMVAPAYRLKVGLMALSVSPPAGHH